MIGGSQHENGYGHRVACRPVSRARLFCRVDTARVGVGHDDVFEFQCSVYDLYNPRGHDIDKSAAANDDKRAFLNYLRARIDDPDDIKSDDLAEFVNDINIILDHYYDNNPDVLDEPTDDIED